MRQFSTAGLTFGRDDLLRWIYVGRLIVVSVMFVAVLAQWFDVVPEVTLPATIMFIGAATVTGASFWYTHLRAGDPGSPGSFFLYAHVVLDVLLVTGIVHITGGQDSSFSPLYVLVISEGALLLPLWGGMFMAALASIAYVADVVWFHGAAVTGNVLYQLILFATVALLTGFLGDRLRRAGIALGAVQSELRQLRLDTGDILASISTGVLTVDSAGRLAYLNPAAEGLLGLEARQWVGAPVVQAMDDLAPGLGRVLRRAIDEGTPIARFRTTTRRNGEEIALAVSTTVLEREGGGPPSATALLQDVSEAERIELLNLRAARLEAVAELSASLAHEIKNPLASIRSAVEQIAKPTLGPDDRQSLVRLVLNESARLSRLLSEFLEFSVLTPGQREIVDISGLVRDCATLVSQNPEKSEGVSVALDFPDDEVTVWGDPGLLHRAVFNLVLNAVQFSGPDGEVRVSVRSSAGGGGVEVPDVVRIAVRDSGPGVPPEDVGRIFDPFYTRRAGGSGLGLAIVHRSIEAHSGTVVVENGEDGGAVFVIDLPREQRRRGPRRE